MNDSQQPPITSDLPTLFTAATTLIQQGRPQEGEAAFAQIVSNFPTCHEAHYMLGRMCQADGRLDDAAKHLTTAESLDQGNPEYTMRLGQVALAAGDGEAALRWLEQSRQEVEMDSVELASAYAQALAMARRFADAAEAFERACNMAPDDARLWMSRATVQQQLFELDGAVESLQRAIALLPADPAPYAQLAVLYERANRLEQARDTVEEALKRDPNHPSALLARARLCRRMGSPDEARQDLEQAVATATSVDARRTACITLAQVLDELGEHDAAYQRMCESKRPAAEIPAGLRHQGDDFLSYLAANRQTMTTSLVASWPAPPPDDRESPIFFVGFPRSGTTLLEQMLASHPRFVTTDERGSLPHVRASLSAALGSIEAVPGALGQLDDEQIRKLRELYWQDIDDLFGAPRLGIRIVDKHPLNVANLGIVRRIFPNAQVIMSLRDPRDVCVSCMMNLTRSPMAATLFGSFETTTDFYAAVMGLWLHFRNVLGLRYIETKYEDVITDAEAEIRRVLAFLGEEWSDEVMQFHERARQRAIRSPSYEQVTRKLHRGAIGRWRHYERHMGASLDTLAPFVTALGYD